jgi:hypothetical protein
LSISIQILGNADLDPEHYLPDAGQRFDLGEERGWGEEGVVFPKDPTISSFQKW